MNVLPSCRDLRWGNPCEVDGGLVCTHHQSSLHCDSYESSFPPGGGRGGRTPIYNYAKSTCKYYSGECDNSHRMGDDDDNDDHQLIDSSAATEKDLCLKLRNAVLSAFFGKLRSRLLGLVLSVPLPVRLSDSDLFKGLLGRMHIIVNEIDEECLRNIRSISSVFSRRLKPQARSVESYCPGALLSPCDGRVVTVQCLGPAVPPCLSQIKRATYSTKMFLGSTLETACASTEDQYGGPSMYQSLLTTLNACVSQTYREEERHNHHRQTSLSSASEAHHLHGDDGDDPFIMSDPDDSPRCLLESSSGEGYADETTLVPERGNQTGVSSAMCWFYCVVYLGPTDYHHFHSPCEFLVSSRKHFTGEVFPVFEGFASRLNNVFSMNERVVLFGSWIYGHMIYAPIAAYNVADIRIVFDKDLRTNHWKHSVQPHQCTYTAPDILLTSTTTTSNSTDDQPPQLETAMKNRSCSLMSISTKSSCPLLKPSLQDDPRHHQTFQFSHAPFPLVGDWKSTDYGVLVPRGVEIGEFRLGSSVVLLFQAPSSFRWTVTSGSPVRVGQTIGTSLLFPCSTE